MGAVKAINALDIAWYNGTKRSSKFVIATSSDGSTFTPVFSGGSSGRTASMERYTFPTVNARYVRVTVNGNTSNTWASISEMAAIAGSTTPPPPPPDPEPTPTPTPTPGKDKFGVTQLYPTKAGGETWFLADNAAGDKRFDPQDTITRNADGSWKMKNSQVRMTRLHVHRLRRREDSHV